MMSWVPLMGYFAALLVGCTFYMKTTIPLRLFAIASNVSFIIYATFHQPVLYPVFILHLFLFPLNCLRLWQLKKMIKRAQQGPPDDYSFVWLVPYMKKEVFAAGHVLFHENDQCDRMYLLKSGSVKLMEINRTVGPGEMLGELSIVSTHKHAIATAICVEPVTALTINETQLLSLYYQNPNFGIYLLRTMMRRFVDNYEVTSRVKHQVSARELA